MSELGPRGPLFTYGAKLVRVVDGDTVHLDLDLGFYQWRREQSYRLLRINAPEMGTPEGKQAKVALETFLQGKALVAHTEKSDHFGRFLVELYANGESVSDWLVANSLAVFKSY